MDTTAFFMSKRCANKNLNGDIARKNENIYHKTKKKFLDTLVLKNKFTRFFGASKKS